MRRKWLPRISLLLLTLAGLAACGDGGGNGSPGGGNPGGGDQGGNDQGGGGTGGAGGFSWPVDTYPVPITPSDAWKNAIQYPDDPFLSVQDYNNPQSSVRWIKFSVLMHDPTKVYYQDSSTYPFHAPFAVERLDPFKGMSIADFDKVSLNEAGQQVILGAVLIPPDPARFPEYGIQLVRRDPYHPEMARIVLDLVKKSINAPAGVEPFYFPTYDQNASAQANASFFAAAGFPVGSVDRWLTGNQCYAPGWALGALRYFPPDQIDSAYASGALKPEDILLTDAIPAELPYLAGIVSLSPSTPNAHTAILATSFGIPFVYLGDAASAQKAKDLVGKQIVLRIRSVSECAPALVSVDGAISPADRDALLALKKPDPLALPEKKPLGQIAKNTDDLGPADAVYFGGKASNYGLIRDAVPSDSEEAIALSFDLWDGFLDQTMPGGKTLRQEIGEKLAPYTYPPNLAALKADLAAIRTHIENDTAFSGVQQKAVIAALASFDPKRKIRFRSSTNVEDSDVFTGAGLYDSASGCLADDTDADATGPSLCDPAQASERGVFRALRKVYASFYNDNAFLARLLYGVDESKVGMALLVHYSYPDTDEMANGVATHVRSDQPIDDIQMVTQLGAVSVTNPAGGSLPEVVHAVRYSWGLSLDTISGSTLAPLGGHVMAWEDDYKNLAGLLAKVADRFAEVHPNKTKFGLDFEYKRMKPGKLFLKQVRELPLPDQAAKLTPFLVDEPRVLCTYQSEQSDVFALHRLKTRVSLSTRTGFLDAAALGATLYDDAALAFAAENGTATLTGSPATWPGAAHAFDKDTATDTFTDGSGANARTFTLTTSWVPTLLPPAWGPIVTARDFAFTFGATYASPVPAYDFDGKPSSRTVDDPVMLFACTDEGPLPAGAVPVTRTAQAGGVTVTSKFYWPPPPKGVVAGYTAPLLRWDETRIEGLTQTPIVLKGYFSQTYRPQHHNFAEDFLFEPALEENLPADVRAELQAKDIRLIYVISSTVVGTIDSAGQFHPL
jgi:hypothetical protein